MCCGGYEVEKGLGKENSKCKDPQAAESLVCSWDRKEALCCTEMLGESGRILQGRQELGHAGPYQP